jgi:hypothetical protein
MNPDPDPDPGTGTGTGTGTSDPAGRRHVIVLRMEPARSRQPAATVWHLRT